MRFFRNYKKEVASFLLVALFYGVVLEQFSAYAKTLPQKIVYSNTYARQNEIEPLEIQQAKEEFISSGENKSAPIVSTINESVDVVESSVLYPADIAYGQIGKTDKIAFDSPEDNLFTITINDEIDSNASYKLSYEVYGVANVAGVTKSINTNTSKGGFFIDKKEDWNRLTEYVLPKKLKKGKNTILFTSDLKTDTGYLVRNVQLEKVKTNKEEILLVNDIVKDIDGKQVYVQGIVQNDLADIKLYANNKPIQLVNNSFEFVIDIEDINVKQLQIEVRKQEEKLAEKQFDIQKLNKTSFTKTLDYAFNQLEYKVTSGKEHQYALENMSVVIKDSSYAKDFTLSIQELRPSDYAPTGMTLHNVTKNQSAYRFLPDGIVFDKDVELRLKYDLKALPRGYNPKDVQVFYFDTNTKQWTKVKVIDILEDTQEVVAVTNHFTDYIAGVIQEPESPETSAFAPTTISGIQVANPTENVAMVSVPQINDQGDAALNFPLMLPPARQGMQPELSINYNSSLDDGDFGIGWNLSMPYIEVDTRWGVAQTDPNKETESYLFNGEELLLVKSDNTLYVPHKEPLINRVNGDVEFRKMQHDPTIIITRKGNNTNYVWQVLDTKTGWTSTYELKGQSSRWNLTSTIDNDGNYVNYYYEEDTKDRKNDMLSKIVYNGNAKLSDPTRIKGTFGAPEEKIFIQIERSNTTRTDRKINNRNNTESPKLIDKIYVYTRANDVESGKYALIEYTFEYKKGQFGRTLLSKIIQDAKNNYDFKVFCCPTSIKQEYLFDYHDDIGTGSLFESTGKTFFTYDDYRTQYDKFGVYLTALGGSEGKSIDFNGGGSVGAVFPFDIPSYIPFSNSATIGVHAGGNSSNSEVKIMMIDIDGDGLVDKVFENGTSYYYRKNLGKEFSKDIYRINNLPRLGYSKTDSGELGANINIIAGSVGKSFSNSGTTTYSYVVDANADGIPDIVDNERVYFGYIDPVTKLPAYNLDSSITPSIVVKEEDVAPILTPMPTVELSNGLMDIVMVWRAPKTGQVQIEGQITKQHISLQSGVKFSIEKLKKDDMGKATFVYGPYLMLSNSDNHNITIDVSQGDLIFFRTHSNQTPAQELGVTWNPKVTYTKENFDSSLSYPQYSSSYQDSFVVGITKEELFKEQGRYKLEWPSFTLNTADQVRVKVSYYKQNTSKTNTGLVPIIGNNIVIYDEVSGYNSNKTYNSPGKILDMNTINDNDPTSFHYIKVEVLADSEVNWKEIDQKFKPKLVSLDGKADVYLTPSYSNYNKTHTSYYPSNFNFSLNKIKIRVNHDFQLPNCPKKVCEDRYIHLIIKDDKNKVVSYNGSLLKFRYKLDAGGNIILREL